MIDHNMFTMGDVSVDSARGSIMVIGHKLNIKVNHYGITGQDDSDEDVDDQAGVEEGNE